MAEETEKYQHEESLGDTLVEKGEDRAPTDRDLRIYPISKILYIVQEGQGGVRLRFGKRLDNRLLSSSLKPRLLPRLRIPLFHRDYLMDTRLRTLDIHPQNMKTKDNVEIGIDAILDFQVEEPWKAILNSQNYILTTEKYGSSLVYGMVQQTNLDDVSTEKMDEHFEKSDSYLYDSIGVKIKRIKIEQINLPQEYRESLAQGVIALQEANARRELARVEKGIALDLKEAADHYQENPIAYELRRFKTLEKISEGRGNTIILDMGRTLGDLLGEVKPRVVKQ